MVGAALDPPGPLSAALAFSLSPARCTSQKKRASRFSVGRRATSSQQVWDMVRKCPLKRSLLWQRCWHPAYADCPLTLIICRTGRKGRQPWDLLINEAVENDKQAWRLVHAYARR